MYRAQNICLTTHFLWLNVSNLAKLSYVISNQTMVTITHEWKILVWTSKFLSVVWFLKKVQIRWLPAIIFVLRCISSLSHRDQSMPMYSSSFPPLVPWSEGSGSGVFRQIFSSKVPISKFLAEFEEICNDSRIPFYALKFQANKAQSLMWKGLRTSFEAPSPQSCHQWFWCTYCDFSLQSQCSDYGVKNYSMTVLQYDKIFS